jgi:hypothetical protein
MSSCAPTVSKHPPAEPEAFRLLAPQRGLIATAQKQISRPKLSFSRKRTAGPANRSLISLESDRREPQIPGTVKLLLPPRQSRGVSHRTSEAPANLSDRYLYCGAVRVSRGHGSEKMPFRQYSPSRDRERSAFVSWPGGGLLFLWRPGDRDSMKTIRSPASFLLPAAWCSAAGWTGTSSPSTPAPAKFCGTSTWAAPTRAARSVTPSMGRFPRTDCWPHC